MSEKALGFVTGGWKWLAAIAAFSALAWLHGCGFGMERVHDKYAKQALGTSEKARGALEGAGAAKASRDDQFDDKQKELENAAQKGTPDPVGAGVSAVLDGMRKQQASGDKATR